MLHRLLGINQQPKKEIKVWKPRHGWSDRTYECQKIFKELGVLMKVMTYEQIQCIIEERTGIKCSRKVILRWKKMRGYSRPHPLKRWEAEKREREERLLDGSL